MRALSIRLFWNGIGEAHADPTNGFKNTTNDYSIHLELRMALTCQISTGKWKYVNPCLDFLGISDQRTAYVKLQERPRWTYVRRSSVTPDLSIGTPSFQFNPLRPRQSGRHFTEDIFKYIFLNENVWISMNISLKFVPGVKLTIFQLWFR